jgi:hypothetical protein
MTSVILSDGEINEEMLFGAGCGGHMTMTFNAAPGGVAQDKSPSCSGTPQLSPGTSHSLAVWLGALSLAPTP